MSEIFDNIYIDRFLLVASVKYTLSQFILFVAGFFFYPLWRLWKLVFFKESIFKVFLYLFFHPKTSNFHNSGLVGRRQLPDPLMNNTFDVLSISLQYVLLFKWPNFGLKCLVTIAPKGQSLKFKTSVWKFPISETGRNSYSLFKLFDKNSAVIMEQ